MRLHVADHPLVAHKLTVLRNKETASPTFRLLVDELVTLLAYEATRDVRVETVPDPTIQDPTDAIVRVTSTGLCGSDLHLYRVLAPFMESGDIIGHEPMGVVEAVGSAVSNLSVGDRVELHAELAVVAS